MAKETFTFQAEVGKILDIVAHSLYSEKEVFLNHAADKEYILFLEHDNYNECCTVQHTEKGVRLKETFKLKDII